jgi:hypothetical protein
MRLLPIAILFPWLLFEPLFHPMRIEKAVIGIVVAFVCMALAPLASGNYKLRPWLSYIGAALAMSNFFFPDSFSVMASHVVAGVALLITGVLPKPRITYTRNTPGPVTETASALLHEPQPGQA